MIQQVPSVTDADVRRVVDRDFAPRDRPHAAERLAEYGVASWQADGARVRMAALKLAKGDLAKLREVMDLARKDPRDVLAAAEYARYAALPHRATEADREAAIARDWSEYQSWLHGG